MDKLARGELPYIALRGRADFWGILFAHRNPDFRVHFWTSITCSGFLGMISIVSIQKFIFTHISLCFTTTYIFPFNLKMKSTDF